MKRDTQLAINRLKTDIYFKMILSDMNKRIEAVEQKLQGDNKGISCDDAVNQGIMDDSRSWLPEMDDYSGEG